MKALPSIQRLDETWRRRARGVAAVSLAAALFLAALVAAHVARIGSVEARIGAGVSVLLVAVLWAAHRVVQWRGRGDARRTVVRTVGRAEPETADRALRALALIERTERSNDAGSPELARVHLDRVLSRVPSDAVDAAARRYAIKWQIGGILAISLAIAGAAADPMRAIEGANVLVARDGRAPLGVDYLAYPRIRALPPSYTRQPERSVVFGASVVLPKGTDITVRGVLRHPGRKLVLTDGRDEVPFLDDGSGGLVARFSVRRDGALRVAARFGDVLVEGTDSLFVHALPDATPAVVLEGAPKTIALADVEDIEVRWIAEDDYALREVDLVLRSGKREDRRVLAHFEGESSVERGAHNLETRDPWLRRMFLPIVLTVQVKDNDPFDGPKWGVSEAFTIMPPAVGEPEALRYAALEQIVEELTEILALRTNDEAEPPPPPLDEQLASFSTSVEKQLSGTYAGLGVPRGIRSFVEGQLRRLRRAPKAGLTDALGETVLAFDVALGSLARRDAENVSKRLGDVAEEVATAARLGRETEDRARELERVDQALSALTTGAGHLVVLGALGADIGAVAESEARRIARARVADDLLHTELAALHLAERLRRATPSFGAKGGKGGVEAGAGRSSGSGSPSPDDVRPSEADRRFDALAEELSRLAREHGDQVGQVDRALEGAADEGEREALGPEAKRRADELRDAVSELPRPGEPPGTRRAMEGVAREHAAAAAHALEKLSLSDALDSTKNALSTLRESRRRPGPSSQSDAELDALEKRLTEEIEWQREALERLAKGAEDRARDALRRMAEREREMAERAKGISERGQGNEAPLPQEVGDRLEKAESVMREAARALEQGRGRDALSLQREAQRLLEQSETGQTSDREDSTPRERSRSGGKVRGGEGLAHDGEVPDEDEGDRAAEFRRRVLRGLSEDKSERLTPAVKRYAEGLLR